MIDHYPNEGAFSRVIVYVLSSLLLVPFFLWLGAFFFRLKIDAPTLVVLGVILFLVCVWTERR